MTIQEFAPLGSKTTMRIGGQARWYADVLTKEDAEAAVALAREHNVPLIVLGGGSNTIFADGVIDAVVIRIKNDAVSSNGQTVTAASGKILAMLLNELAEQGLDLSPLTGIPGTIGGALFGNAGQGAGGIWLDSFVQSVTLLADGTWRTVPREECAFRYRESMFKDLAADGDIPPILWEVTLNVPQGEPAAITAEIGRLLQKRIETQPHLKTAGSCFKSLPDGTPAWKLIDAAGLRGKRFGDIEISEKHANFLLNVGKATFDDVRAAVDAIREAVPQIAQIEMRLYGNDGRLVGLPA